MCRRPPGTRGKGVNLALLGVVAALLNTASGFSQRPCTTGVSIEGTVTDPTGAMISKALVAAASGEMTTTDAIGHYLLPCVRSGLVTVVIQADGFTSAKTTANRKPGGSAHFNFRLTIARVETTVQVAGDATAMDSDHGVGTKILNTETVQMLADDPDDLQRQLQVLAASGGASGGTAMITVDGFQNESALPPKSSIASIRINPDLYSSEFESPPWYGGRIEIFTKPGATSFHGALFLTDSDSSFNATDPFSLTATPASKRRYGFELTGPIVSKKIDFSLALEKRDINEFNIVNATILDADDNQLPLHQAISAPQRLWIASARSDWQITPKDAAIFSFSSNVNNLSNQGVGGLALLEAGYSNLLSEYDLRLTNVLTLSSNLLHETRIGYTWKRTKQTPLSVTPSIQVAGYFTGGGATSQSLNNRERDLEVDDDLIFVHGKHNLKVGVESLGIFVHDYDPDTFNGSYVFGGGGAPELDANNNPTSQTTTISGMEQYRRASLNLAGGIPTTYQITTGTPLVPLTQWRVALYAQDIIKLTSRVSLSTGLRYVFQTSPNSFLNFAPRMGLSWALDKKSTWIFHVRAGLFNGSINPTYATQVHRLNGIRQKEALVYSPNYTNPLQPVTGSIQVSTVWQFPKTFDQVPSVSSHVALDHYFPSQWHVEAAFYWGDSWGVRRVRNINAPLINSSSGVVPDPIEALHAPRPFAPNLNIFQYQNSGHLIVDKDYALILDQNKYKRFGLSIGYEYINTRSNGGTVADSPQSSYSDQGESSRADWQRTQTLFVRGNVIVPRGVVVSALLDAGSGRPYNITTGTDANGDGNFNDRPSYAFAPGAGVYNTRFGLLTTNTINGNAPRNLGTMPAVVHLDANLSRAFRLHPKSSTDLRSLTFNVRSANLLNHTNVTAVNTILSSSSVGHPITAEPARRIEIGLRFAF
jgi:hypothetical protein